MRLTKNDMARVIQQARCDLAELPEATHGEVQAIARRHKVPRLRKLYDDAVKILQKRMHDVRGVPVALPNMPPNRLEVHINGGNAAFCPDPAFEFARILRDIADRLGAAEAGQESIQVRDSNGNQCGRCLIYRVTSKAAEAKEATLEDFRAVARAVLEWARTPCEHGGNPYTKHFVRLAQVVMGDD